MARTGKAGNFGEAIVMSANRPNNYPERKVKMKRKMIVSLTVVIAVIVVFSLVVIPNAFAAMGGTDLPFKATLVGAASWKFPGSSPSNCTVVTTFSESTGQATHMGQIEAFSSHCPAEPAYVNDGKIRIIAANGDKLFGTYNYDPNSQSNEIPITLNGGTGAFADASGTVIMTYEVIAQFIPGCNLDPDPFPCMDFSKAWPWSATLTGTISY